MRPVRPAITITCIAALALAGCGDDDDGGGAARDGAAKTVTVYSSLPLQGASRPISEAVSNGIRMALDEAGGRAGEYAVRYESLDDATAQAGAWTPEATSANARKVAQHDGPVIYIGELNSGATAVSLPILNEAGIPQISTNTAVGLTSDEPGATPGEPDKYYPTGQRTYVRVAPKDTVQGAALATLMQEDGCRNVQVLNDKEVYGSGLAEIISRSAETQGVTVAGNEAIDKVAANYRSLAARAASAGVDCVVYAGITANNAVQLFKDFADALPEARLYGADGISDESFTDPANGGIPEEVARRTSITVATLAPDQYPPDGQEFFRQYESEYGDANPDPWAIYGYEAMRLALNAVERSGTAENEDVLAALFDTRDRESVLGTYSIDEKGDTTLTDYGVYSIEGGELVFEKTVAAQVP
jgi:branched-chain amino acid transport system substrate-binding protein